MTDPQGVLVTRPQPGADSTAGRIAELGLRPVVAPLLSIRLLRTALPPSVVVQAILVTSANAVAALPVSHRQLPLYAVGDATAAAAQAAGFEQVRSADGDATALAELVGRSCDRRGQPLLLASGRGQGELLATKLRSQGFGILRRAVYAAVPVSALPKAARDAFTSGFLTAAMFFSAETAGAGARLLQDARLLDAIRNVDALAIGKPAAVALEALPWRRIRVALRPNLEAMLALLR